MSLSEAKRTKDVSTGEKMNKSFELREELTNETESDLSSSDLLSIFTKKKIPKF